MRSSLSPDAQGDPSPGKQPPTLVRFLILAFLCAAASIAYICRQSIGVAESTIRTDLNLSEEAMGSVMSSFFLAYALAQVPTGWFGNAIGARKAIPIFAVAWSWATGIMYFAGGAPLLFASRITNGLAQAGLFPAATTTIGKWFPTTGRGVASGALGGFMSIGGAIGVAVTGTLVVTYGWRITFVSYGCLSLLFAGIFYLFFRNSPYEHPWTNEAERELAGDHPQQKRAVSSRREVRAVYLSPATWWICGQQFCRAAGQIFFGSWFATYLQETRGVSVEESGFLNSLPLTGLVIGSLVGGSVSDFILMTTSSRWLARSGVACTSMVLCALFVFGAYLIQHPVLAVLIISLGTFCAAVGGPCAYSVTIDMGGRHTAILFATMNMIGNLGAFAFIRTVPTLVKWTNWDAVLLLFGCLYLGAAFFWLILNPRGNILDQSFLKNT